MQCQQQNALAHADKNVALVNSCESVIPIAKDAKAQFSDSPNKISEVATSMKANPTSDFIICILRAGFSSWDDWLLEIDKSGNLLGYSSAVAECFGMVEALSASVTASANLTRQGNGDLPVVQFLDQVGVVKVGHRRLFERWFRGNQ